MRKLLLLSFSLFSIGYMANAQELYEDFEGYTSGALVGQGDWEVNNQYPLPSGGENIKVSAFGLNGDRAAHINPGGVAGDGPMKPFFDNYNIGKNATSGVVYVSFLVKFNALPGTGASYFFFLADFTGSKSSNGRGRIYVKSNGEDKFAFAVTASSAAAPASNDDWTPYNYEAGKTYLVVLKYEKNSEVAQADMASLWIYDSKVTGTTPPPPTIVSGAETPSKKDIGGVGFRTFSNGYNIVIDDITADASWEYATNYTEVPMPVKLTSFTAQQQNNGIQLNWTTASEQNNSHFEVLRSADGENFNLLTTITGKGTTSESNNYNYTDVNPISGTNYYQLRQVDFDGKSESSKIVAVNNTLKETTGMWVSASSEQDYVKLNVHSAVSEEAVVYINGISGNRIAAQKINLAQGANEIQIPVNSVNGVYVANLVSATYNISTKFVK